MQQARESIAGVIGADPDEIYFTSGGTESDNWAILGTADAQQKKGKHLITSAIEHHAVLETMEYLEKRGWEFTKVPVDGGGLVDPEDVRKAIRPDTVLVSIMHGNNEVGTIQPIARDRQDHPRGRRALPQRRGADGRQDAAGRRAT